MASEALELFLADLLEQGKSLPQPRNIRDVEPSDNSIVSYISADPNKYRKNTKAVRKTLSIPAWLADEAKVHNLSLSKILQDGLKDALGLS